MKKNIKKNNQKRFSLDKIDELKFLLVITKPQLEKAVIERLEEMGGRVLMSRIGEGVGKNSNLELLGISSTESALIFGVARKEDADNLLIALNMEFNFAEPGNGLGLTIDVDGYMGTKGLFV